MGAFATRQVILLSFPFSDLSASKLLPALLLAPVGKGNWVLCQITSNPYADSAAVEITGADFLAGSLQRTSYARSGKLFTANETLFRGIAGFLKAEKQSEVVNVIVAMLQAGTYI